MRRGPLTWKAMSCQKKKKNSRNTGCSGVCGGGRSGKQEGEEPAPQRFSVTSWILDISQSVIGHWRPLSRWSNDTIWFTFLNCLSGSLVEKTTNVLENVLIFLKASMLKNVWRPLILYINGWFGFLYLLLRKTEQAEVFQNNVTEVILKQYQ